MRRPRWRLILGGVAAVLAAALAGTLVLTLSGRQSAAAPAAAPAALSCAFASDPQAPPTGVATAATPLTIGSGPQALPAGWVWQLDLGFAVGVPRGWLRSTHAGAICLLDPGGRRALAVDGATSTDPDRVAYWRHEESSLLATRAPAGYRRVDISPALYREGGADWEYTYLADQVRWHVLRRSFAIGEGRAYVVSWTTTDTEWNSNQRTFRTIMQSFELR